MPDVPASLTTELGTPGTPFGRNGWTIDEWEETVELTWPASITVFDRMRSTDAQTAGVLRAVILPILFANWRLGREGVDPRVLQATESEFGLTPNLEARARRRRQGIAWREYWRHAFLTLIFGHMPFEQVWDIGPPAPEQMAQGMPTVMAHLRKLGPRMPRSLTSIDIAPDGGLEGIRQLKRGNANDPQYREVQIPVDRLVFHVHEKEGADWRGRSILRASYKHWMIADLLTRQGPMVVERNGMGLPVVTFDPNTGTRTEALEIARSTRGGEEAGVALPTGYTLQLLGVSGTVRDELPLLKWHMQQIGKNALAMVLDLGHDRGARSLGDTFFELFALSLNSIAADQAEICTEYAIRDFVALNFGPDEPYPPLIFDEITPEAAINWEGLANLVKVGVVLPDDDLEDEVRRRARLPRLELDSSIDGRTDVLPTLDPTQVPPPPIALPPAPAPAALAVMDELDAMRARLAARQVARR